MKLHHLLIALTALITLASCRSETDLNPPLPKGPYFEAPPIPHRKFKAMYFGSGQSGYGGSRYNYTGDSVYFREQGEGYYNGRSYGPGGIVVLPPGSRRVRYGGQMYYTDGASWYRPYGSGGYMIVPTPY